MTCGFSDFDFLIGQWRVHHRQLSTRMAHCQRWQEFTGRSEARKILGGFGIIDESIFFEPHGTYRSMSLRTFDTETNVWSIWWYDGRLPARLLPPVSGKFQDSIGVFLGERVIEGAPVCVRYVWTRHDDAPRCEQAFSANHGETWETTWVMEFRRAS